MASSSLSIQRRQPQPGSVGKEWDREELLSFLGTPEKRSLNLEGEVHPVFQKWDGCEQDLRRELEQPPLLASHLLEVSGLDWISDFVIDDIFDEQYPGRETCQWPRSYFQQTVPETIVRHHRAAWATPDSKRRWLDQASEELRDETSKSIEWQLDPDIFPEKGWVGYTCRHPRSGLSLRELDGYETIEKWDKVSREQGQTRKLTILLMAEYPRRMRELPKDSEEYLLTSFMTSVTILHELAHVMFWRDFRSLTRGMCEPFYGADLEIELGDSFIAHIFGGWVPVPIKEPVEVRAAPTFESGLAWKQHLSWDYHRLRPRYRALYSIRPNSVAKLFKESNWKAGGSPESLIQPQSLVAYEANADLDLSKNGTDLHATAALPDFHLEGGDWVWNKRTGARFRIPQYEGTLWPDFDLPVTTDDVIQEAQPRDARCQDQQVKGMVEAANIIYRSPSDIRTTPAGTPIVSPRSGSKRRQSPPLSIARLSKEDFHRQCFSLGYEALCEEKHEIMVDELKKRLSRLVEVSITELEGLFDAC